MATDRKLAAAMAELAAEDLTSVLHEARAEARERVRGLLADALTEAMLAQATAAPETQAPADTAPAEVEPVRASTGTGLYVYGIVPAGTALPPDLPGIDPLDGPGLVTRDAVSAVCSRVPLTEFDEQPLREHLADMEWLERTARTHQRVLEQIGTRCTLVPMRLCTVYRDERGVREMLGREAGALQDALAQLSGKHEWGVKVFATEIPPEPGNLPPMNSGTDYMLSRRLTRQSRVNEDERRHAACFQIHERVAAQVADALTCPLQRPEVSGHDGPMLLNGVYLVEDGDLDEFLALVESLGTEHAPDGLELELSGPWPAYNFVPGTIGAAW